MTIIPWQTLTVGKQENISQLCEVVESGKLGEAYIAQYMETMAAANDQSPRMPHLNGL